MALSEGHAVSRRTVEAPRVDAKPELTEPAPSAVDDRVRPLISVVAPFYNEEASLERLLARLAAVADKLADRYRFEFVLVDDGSRDGSLALALRLAQSERRLRVIELRRNYGQTAALQAGLDCADGDVIVSMDADLQHFQEEIPLFLERIEAGSDVVCGWRSERKEGIVRRWPSMLTTSSSPT